MGDSADDGAVGLTVGGQALGEVAQERVIAFGDESWHVEGLAKVAVAATGEPSGVFSFP